MHAISHTLLPLILTGIFLCLSRGEAEQRQLSHGHTGPSDSRRPETIVVQRPDSHPQEQPRKQQSHHPSKAKEPGLLDGNKPLPLRLDLATPSPESLDQPASDLGRTVLAKPDISESSLLKTLPPPFNDQANWIKASYADNFRHLNKQLNGLEGFLYFFPALLKLANDSAQYNLSLDYGLPGRGVIVPEKSFLNLALELNQSLWETLRTVREATLKTSDVVHQIYLQQLKVMSAFATEMHTGNFTNITVSDELLANVTNVKRLKNDAIEVYEKAAVKVQGFVDKLMDLEAVILNTQKLLEFNISQALPNLEQKKQSTLAHRHLLTAIQNAAVQREGESDQVATRLAENDPASKKPTDEPSLFDNIMKDAFASCGPYVAKPPGHWSGREGPAVITNHTNELQAVSLARILVAALRLAQDLETTARDFRFVQAMGEHGSKSNNLSAVEVGQVFVRFILGRMALFEDRMNEAKVYREKFKAIFAKSRDMLNGHVALDNRTDVVKLREDFKSMAKEIYEVAKETEQEVFTENEKSYPQIGYDPRLFKHDALQIRMADISVRMNLLRLRDQNASAELERQIRGFARANKTLSLRELPLLKGYEESLDQTPRLAMHFRWFQRYVDMTLQALRNGFGREVEYGSPYEWLDTLTSAFNSTGDDKDLQIVARLELNILVSMHELRLRMHQTRMQLLLRIFEEIGHRFLFNASFPITNFTNEALSFLKFIWTAADSAIEENEGPPTTLVRAKRDGDNKAIVNATAPNDFQDWVQYKDLVEDLASMPETAATLEEMSLHAGLTDVLIPAYSQENSRYRPAASILINIAREVYQLLRLIDADMDTVQWHLRDLIGHIDQVKQLTITGNSTVQRDFLLEHFLRPFWEAARNNVLAIQEATGGATLKSKRILTEYMQSGSAKFWDIDREKSKLNTLALEIWITGEMVKTKTARVNKTYAQAQAASKEYFESIVHMNNTLADLKDWLASPERDTEENAGPFERISDAIAGAMRKVFPQNPPANSEAGISKEKAELQKKGALLAKELNAALNGFGCNGQRGVQSIANKILASVNDGIASQLSSAVNAFFEKRAAFEVVQDENDEQAGEGEVAIVKRRRGLNAEGMRAKVQAAVNHYLSSAQKNSRRFEAWTIEKRFLRRMLERRVDNQTEFSAAIELVGLVAKIDPLVPRLHFLWTRFYHFLEGIHHLAKVDLQTGLDSLNLPVASRINASANTVAASDVFAQTVRKNAEQFGGITSRLTKFARVYLNVTRRFVMKRLRGVEGWANARERDIYFRALNGSRNKTNILVDELLMQQFGNATKEKRQLPGCVRPGHVSYADGPIALHENQRNTSAHIWCTPSAWMGGAAASGR